MLLTSLASHFAVDRGSPSLAAVPGDVNCDETVNSVDALGVLRSIAGLSTPACNDAADVIRRHGEQYGEGRLDEGGGSVKS